MREIGAQLFGDLRRQAESVISAKINDELDTKLRHKFDWSMVEARGITSPYVKDAFDFVDKIFAHLTSLGMRAELLNDIYFDTYQHIGFSFMEKVIDERIVIINMGAIHQLNLDILYCLGRVGHVKCKFRFFASYNRLTCTVMTPNKGQLIFD